MKVNFSFFRPVFVIAQSTFKEVIRDRLLYGILLIAFLVTASSFFLATISLEQNGRVLENVGLASIHYFAAFICIFVTSNSLYRDFDRRALYLLLPKPITRSQYILGKYLGMVYLLITTMAILATLFSVGVLAIHKELLITIPLVLSFSFIEICLLIAISLMFATFTAPLNASLYTTALFVIGHSITFVRDYLGKFGTPFEHNVMEVVYYVLPNLSKFDIRQAVLYGIYPSVSQVAWTVVYWAIYLCFVLALAQQVMKKREV